MKLFQMIFSLVICHTKTTGCVVFCTSIVLVRFEYISTKTHGKAKRNDSMAYVRTKGFANIANVLSGTHKIKYELAI